MAEGSEGSDGGGAGVLQSGYLRKLKSLRKRWFVVLGGPEPRLQCFESERKWRAGSRPRREVPAAACLGVAQRLDTRHAHVLALYTRDDCLCLVLDSEPQLAAWLAALTPQPDRRQFVWQVNVQKKGLGATHNIVGYYNLCLTDKKLSLVKLKPNNSDVRVTESIEFSLMSIRRCGDSECFFYMEVGRSTVTGAGELWMHTEDANIAQSMHSTILRAMSSEPAVKDELGPKSRSRSSSANDASMPMSVLSRRQTHTGSKSHGLSPSSDSTFCGGRSCVGLCISQCVTASAAYCIPQEADTPQTEQIDSKPKSSNDTVVDNSGNVAGKPPIEDCHVLKVVHERTRSLPLCGDETNINISNELSSKARKKIPLNSSSEKMIVTAPKDCHKVSQKTSSQMNWGRRASTGCRVVKWSPSHIRSGSVGSISGVRERCDSLPSRANATMSVPQQHTQSGLSRFIPRPHSMFIGHPVGQSPPVISNSPLSPNSGACSTDSAGSSISIDETDNFHHSNMIDEKSSMVGRLLTSHTPDQGTIPEEVADETTGTWSYLKDISEYIGNDTIDAPTSNSGFKETTSPVPITGASSNIGDYMPMSPASVDLLRMTHSLTSTNSANHSRTSSIVEEVMNADGLSIPKNKTDAGYVDMGPSTNTNENTMSPVGSVSSVVSGTPSTDFRFSEYHLEKVFSYLSPSEEGEENRPTRAHSLGSRPDHLKKVINRPETSHNTTSSSSSSRTRAFSLGNRSKYKENRVFNPGTPPHHQMLHLQQNSSHSGSESSSVPLLSGVSHVATPSRTPYNVSQSFGDADDLMEMDFTNNSSTTKPEKISEIENSLQNMSFHSSPSAHTHNAKMLMKNVVEGYMDMSPVNVAKSNFLDLKSEETTASGNSTPKTISSVRKTSIAKSPPPNNSGHHLAAPCTPEGYVEMSWNTNKAKELKTHSIFTEPIRINIDTKKDTKVSSQIASSSTSPNINFSSFGMENEHIETKVDAKSPPRMSSSNSVTPSLFPSLKRRSNKHTVRRNSKEFTDQVQTSSLTNPLSPMKPISTKPPTCEDKSRKYPIDNSDPLKFTNVEVGKFTCNKASSDMLFSPEESFSDYLDMNPARLTTVTEINETGSTKIDKDMKQLINNATKEYSNMNADLSDYISLNPNATIDARNVGIKSIEESSPSICSYKGSFNYSLPIPYTCSSNPQNTRKNSAPIFTDNISFSKNIDSDAKENQGILSSNPLANKNMMINPMINKSSTNISNIKQVQNVRMPKLVTVTGQTQSTTANFKPIQTNESWEPRSTKSGSPKPVESVLNRQLAGTMGDNKNVKSEAVRNDGYEILIQNGQFSNKQNNSRPSSVNNNKYKKGNGSSSRPPSVTSQGEISGNNPTTLSRPSSVSSDMNSTPANSRPASVTGEREAGGRVLHYASLELDAPSERSPRPPPTPLANRPTFSYAQIDYGKSEELKNSKNLSATTKN